MLVGREDSMEVAIPAFAIVRPRVVATRSDEPRLLDEVVAEIADEYGSGIVRVTGSSGSGKSTALAHLAAVFSYNENMIFLDDPSAEELEACPGDSLCVAAVAPGGGHHLELALQSWGIDELIEYLLTAHHDACGSVIERLGAAARYRWLPQVATIVLRRFVADAALDNPVDALVHHVEAQLPTPAQRHAAAAFSLAMQLGGNQRVASAAAKVARAEFPDECRKLLRLEMIQLPLAAERLKSLISSGYFGDLENKLPRKLVKLVGRRCMDAPDAIRNLVKLLESNRAEGAHAMAASILLAADPEWRPLPRRRPFAWSGGIFRDAKWQGVNLTGASLDSCDFSDANLDEAKLANSRLNNACFDGSTLRRALLVGALATGATFRGALLQQARLGNATLIKADFEGASLGEAVLSNSDLTAANFSSAHLQLASFENCRLSGANFSDCDLTQANLEKSVLTGVDLRSAVLDGACFAEAVMKAVQLEDVHATGLQLQKSVLIGAHLTGSSFPAADLRGANLMGAGLAEIDWEGADLRGANLRTATFHMGSSRSGLVGSPYACEGSKTGFYTDDFEDMSFKRPEEVRKANLCGADLRGALAEKVDFYLVDLRGAKLDPALRERARATGAILEDVVE